MLKILVVTLLAVAQISSAEEPGYKVILNPSTLLHNLARRERMKLFPTLVRDPAAEARLVKLLRAESVDAAALAPPDENTVRTALGLFLTGQCDENTFGTLLLRWQLWQDFGAAAVGKPTLFTVAQNSGAPTAWGDRLFRGPLAQRRDPQPWTGLPANLSSTERSVMVAAVPRSAVEKTLRTELFISENFPDVVGPGNVAVLAPSIAVINAYLSARHGRLAVTLRPQIKSSYVEGFLKDMSEGFRPLGLSYPNVWVPPTTKDPISGFTLSPTVFAASDIERAARPVDPRYLRLLPRFLSLFDRAYEKRQPKEGPTYELVPGLVTVHEKNVAWGEDRTFVGNRPEMFSHLIMDLDLPSMKADPNFSRGLPCLGETWIQDFGGVGDGLAGLFVYDLAKHPEIYEALGIDIASTVGCMGEEAARLFQKARRAP